jgi:hypothetical protein
MSFQQQDMPQEPTTTVMTAPVKTSTRIEGMEALDIEEPMLSEADKRMKEEELSFYSASENGHGDDNIWGLLSGVGGNIYEWYVASLQIYTCFETRMKIKQDSRFRGSLHSMSRYNDIKLPTRSNIQPRNEVTKLSLSQF